MLTLIAIVAFVSIPYALEVYFDTSSDRPSDEENEKACHK